MTTDLDQGSAKVYQFPVGGREARGGRQSDETKPTTGQGSQQTEACSGSWYHEAAIAESDPTWHR